MTERPVLFNCDMVRAILRGQKTQTRRPPQPSAFSYILIGYLRNIYRCMAVYATDFTPAFTPRFCTATPIPLFRNVPRYVSV